MTRYLVLQAARFGDLIQTKRLLMTLLSRGEVHLLVDFSLASLAKILYPKISVHSFHFHGNPTEEWIRDNRQTLSELVDCSPSCLINCNYSPLTATLSRAFDCEIIGYRPSHTSRGGILRAPLLRLASKITEKRSLACINLVDLWANLIPSPIDPNAVNPLPKSRGNVLGVVLQGREERRSLPDDVLADCIRVFAVQRKSSCIRFFGTESDRAKAYHVRRALQGNIQHLIEDLTGKTSWEGLIENMADLDCLLTPDTGTMHLAAHLGVPVQAFFLSSAFCHETGPYGENHRIIQAVQSCTPCLESHPCQKNLLCLEPFRDRGFLRALSQIARDEDPKDLPSGLLSGKSVLDGLGVRYSFSSENEEIRLKRASLRQFLSDFLHLSLSEKDSDPQFAAEMLLDDTEWMLPPQRYS